MFAWRATATRHYRCDSVLVLQMCASVFLYGWQRPALLSSDKQGVYSVATVRVVHVTSLSARARSPGVGISHMTVCGDFEDVTSRDRSSRYDVGSDGPDEPYHDKCGRQCRTFFLINIICESTIIPKWHGVPRAADRSGRPQPAARPI